MLQTLLVMEGFRTGPELQPGLQARPLSRSMDPEMQITIPTICFQKMLFVIPGRYLMDVITIRLILWQILLILPTLTLPLLLMP